MRILIMSNAYTPTLSGVVTSIKVFRQGLKKAGHEVFVFAPNYWRFKDTEKDIFRVPALDLSPIVDFSYPWPLRKKIVAAARALKPDIIHCQHPSVMGDRAVDVARALKIPLVATFHCRYDIYARYLAPTLRTMISNLTRSTVALFANKCDAIILPGRSMRGWLHSTHKVRVPVEVLPTPVNLSLYKNLRQDAWLKKLGLKKEQVLLFVGRLSHEKNIDLLIRAMPFILTEKPQMHLVIVGRGPERRRLMHLARKLGLGRSVIFNGPCPNEEVPMLLASAGIYLFASEIESQALAVIEALAAGTPVVAVDSPATREVLEMGGGVLTPKDPGRFARVVLGILNDEIQWKTLSRQAIKSAGRYSVPVQVKSLVNLYQQTLDSFRK